MTNEEQLNTLKRQRAYLVECRDNCEGLSVGSPSDELVPQLKDVFTSDIQLTDELIKLKKMEMFFDELPKETK